MHLRLAILLRRPRDLDATIQGALVDSRSARHRGLPEIECKADRISGAANHEPDIGVA